MQHFVLSTLHIMKLVPAQPMGVGKLRGVLPSLSLQIRGPEITRWRDELVCPYCGPQNVGALCMVNTCSIMRRSSQAAARARNLCGLVARCLAS